MITFEPLKQSDFPILLKWLTQPYVKKWWDPEMNWTSERVAQKYSPYVQGFKLEKGKMKKIQAYIICSKDKPIGYIQFYNAYDFERSIPLEGLPGSLGAFDVYIGEQEALGKGLGTKALLLFLNSCGRGTYEYILADPDAQNKAAIKAYENAGFKKITDSIDSGESWMILNVKNDSNSLNFRK